MSAESTRKYAKGGQVPATPVPSTPVPGEGLTEVPATTPHTGDDLLDANQPATPVTHNATTSTTNNFTFSTDLEAEKARLREQWKAELRAELEAEQRASTPEALLREAEAELADVEVVVDDGRTTLIHFIADGMTVGASVYYRGQELRVANDAAWLHLTPRQQIARFGRRMFGIGPWSGSGFDLDDPVLTPSDRQALLDATRKRQALLAGHASGT